MRMGLKETGRKSTKQVPQVSYFFNYSFMLKYPVPALTYCVLIHSFDYENLQAVDANEYKRMYQITPWDLEEPLIFFFLMFTGAIFRFKNGD